MWYVRHVPSDGIPLHLGGGADYQQRGMRQVGVKVSKPVQQSVVSQVNTYSIPLSDLLNVLGVTVDETFSNLEVVGTNLILQTNGVPGGGVVTAT